MNMEYWMGVVQTVNGVSFFDMLFSFGATGVLLAIANEEFSTNKNPKKLYKLAAIAASAGAVFTLLLIFVPSAAAVKAMYM